jgi:NitT/TauT family transport system substrate-binding protein
MKMTLAAAVPRHSDCDRASSLALMLRSRALSASTRVFDALWRGVSKHEGHGPPHPSRRRLRRLLRMKAEVEPRRSGQNLCAAILVGLTAIATAQTSAAETLKVAVAQPGFWNSTFIDVGLKQGYFKQAGLDIEILYTEGGASTLTPVIAGSIDIAMTNGILGVVAAYAKGMPVKIISAEATGAAEAFWYARPESGIRRLADTNGKTVAYSSPGSSTNLILLQLVSQAKVAPKLVATGGAPATLTQVMSGQIDVGWSVPPFVLQQLADGKLVIIARGSDVPALAQQTIRVNVANANVLKERRDAFVRFIKALSRAIDWAYSDPGAIDHYAEIAKVPRTLAQQTRDEFFPKEALQLAEVKGLDVTLKQALEFKYITLPMSLADAQGMLDILYKPDEK